MYGDIILNELLDVIQLELENELANISEGVLHLLLSTNGALKNIELPIIRRKTNKQLIVDESKV